MHALAPQLPWPDDLRVARYHPHAAIQTSQHPSVAQSRSSSVPTQRYSSHITTKGSGAAFVDADADVPPLGEGPAANIHELTPRSRRRHSIATPDRPECHPSRPFSFPTGDAFAGASTGDDDDTCAGETLLSLLSSNLSDSNSNAEGVFMGGEAERDDLVSDDAESEDGDDAFKTGRLSNENIALLQPWSMDMLASVKAMSDKTGLALMQLANIVVSKIKRAGRSKPKFNTWNVFQHIYKEDRNTIKRLFTDTEGNTVQVPEDAWTAYLASLQLYDSKEYREILSAWLQNKMYSAFTTLGDRAKAFAKAKQDMVDIADVNSNLMGIECVFIMGGCQPNDDQALCHVHETRRAQGVRISSRSSHSDFCLTYHPTVF